LSGSKLLLILIVAFLAACTPKKGLKDSSTTDSGVRIYNPKTGEYELVKDPKTLIDTVEWSEKTNVPDPIGPITEVKKGKKDQYEITFLMPFDAGGVSFGNSVDAKSRRFLNYYGGVKFALQDLAADGIDVIANVMDTRESPEVVGDLLKTYDKSDVIIGPYGRDALQIAAEFAGKKGVTVISPWTPSIVPDYPSENFVQVVPGLQTHADAAMKYVARAYPNARYLLVATQENKDQSRMDIYNEAFSEVMSGKPAMEKLIIDEKALSPDSNALTSIYDTSLVHVFFMPYYSRSEEAFVNSLMRKVHAEHGFTKVVFVGLPQWENFSSIDPDYLESLNTHITAFQYVDNKDPEVREFNRRYYNRYGGVPEPAARRGYDLTMYVGRKLSEHGTGFINIVQSEYDRDFRFRPVSLTEGSVEKRDVAFIENKGIAILIFENQQFQRLE